MKITIYELLGLVREGKAPHKIRDVVTGCIYSYDIEWKDYKSDDTPYYFIDKVKMIGWLDEEVEIIEEKKEIEKLKKPTVDEHLHKVGEDLYIQDMEVYDKINEIIDEINRLKKGNDDLSIK